MKVGTRIAWRLRQLLEWLAGFLRAGAGRFPWEPVRPRIRSTPADRDPARYGSVIDQFEVETSRRYAVNQRGQGETYCNIFAWDVTVAMGAEIPHWLGEDCNACAPGRGVETTANRIVQWLEEDGARHGWHETDLDSAGAHACTGRPGIAAWFNPSGPGHVAMLRPGVLTEAGPLLAQAGKINSSAIRCGEAFGQAWGRGEVRYFIHD